MTWIHAYDPKCCNCKHFSISKELVLRDRCNSPGLRAVKGLCFVDIRDQTVWCEMVRASNLACGKQGSWFEQKDSGR